MSNSLEKVKILKELIVSKLQEDYKIAKENDLHYCYGTYEDLINKANNISINKCLLDEWKIDYLADKHIEEINDLLNDELDGTYKHATNRINLLAMDVDFIKNMVE